MLYCGYRRKPELVTEILCILSLASMPPDKLHSDFNRILCVLINDDKEKLHKS